MIKRVRYFGNLEVLREALKQEDFSLVRNFKRIILKPNFVSSRRFPFTSRPEILPIIFSFFKEKFPNMEIFICESTFHGFMNVANKLGLFELTLPLVDLDTVPIFMSYKRGAPIEIYFLPEILKDSYRISIANLKQHPEVGYSGVLKNIFGIVPTQTVSLDGRKELLHFPSIEKNIISLFLHMPFHYAILDATVICRWEDEIGKGEPIQVEDPSFVLGDPIEVDEMGTEIMAIEKGPFFKTLRSYVSRESS